MASTTEVTVTRRTTWVLGLALACLAVAGAWFYQAARTGDGWLLGGGLGVLGLVWARVAMRSRTPLLTADEIGIRARWGSAWCALPWGSVESISETTPSHFRGRSVLVQVHEADKLMQDWNVLGRLRGRWNFARFGTPLLIPVDSSVRVTTNGAAVDLIDGLIALADVEELPDGEADGHETRPHFDWTKLDPRPTLANTVTTIADRLPAPQSPTPAARSSVGGVRADAVITPTPTTGALAIDPREEAAQGLPEEAELRRNDPDVDDLTSDSQRGWKQSAGIGFRLAAARSAQHLSVDDLAARTRIRAHVIEGIEAEDFSVCGGDFYARGHLRTLARVLSLNGPDLVRRYDRHYGDDPVPASKIFAAELAHSSMRKTTGGMNWSLIVAVVMTLVLIWSVARLVMQPAAEIHEQAPPLNGSNGPPAASAITVPVTLTGKHGGADIVVRDGDGDVVSRSTLAFGETRTVKAAPPITVKSTDAGAITVRVGDKKHGTLGKSGVAGEKVFKGNY